MNKEGMKIAAIVLILTLCSLTALSVQSDNVDADTGVARIGNTTYPDLTSAVEAVQSGETAKITLIADANVQDFIGINGQKKITLDLNGHDIIFDPESDADWGLYVLNGSLKIEGTGTLKGGYTAITVYGINDPDASNFSVLNVGKNVTIEGDYAIILREDPVEGSKKCGYGAVIDIYGTIQNTDAAVWVMGNITETDGNVAILNIHDGATVTSNDVGVAANGYAKVTIGDTGKGTAPVIEVVNIGVEVRAGEVTINKADITATAEPTEVDPNSSGTTTAGAAVSVSQHTTKLPITVEIKDGTFDAYSAFVQSNPQNNSEEDVEKISVALKGGMFTGAVSSENFSKFITGGNYSEDPSELVADGYIVVQEGDRYKVCPPIPDTNQPIWPTAEYDEDHYFYPWTREAEWTETDGVVYWLDQTSGNWFTVLNGNELVVGSEDNVYGTSAEVNGVFEAFRVRAEGPASAGIDENWVPEYLFLEFYNFRNGYTITNTVIDAKSFNPNGMTIETEKGTLYVDALKVKLQGNVLYDDNPIPVSYSMFINVPVLVVKKNISEEFNYEYVYNGLWQTPLAYDADNGNASDLYYAGAPEDAVAYCNTDAPYFDFSDITAKIPEGTEWNVEGKTKDIYTNKYYALLALQACEKDAAGNYVDEDGKIVTVDDFMEPYVITLTPKDSLSLTGKITITWWIVPMGIEDIDFKIQEPYYDFDNEVRPKVVMTWYEPEDGPNGAKKHYILEDKVQIDYTMPEDYPYEMPFVLVPKYEQKTISVQDVDDEGNPVYSVYEDVVVSVQAVDDEGNPLFEKATEEPLQVQATDIDGNPLFRHFRYEDGSFVYEQAVGADGKLVYDEDGNPVYDLDKPVMVPVMVDRMVPVMTTKTVRVYDTESDPVMVDKQVDDETKPLKVQAEDEHGQPMYEKIEQVEKRYEDGSIVYEQKKDSKGKPVYDENGKPVYDETKPVMVDALNELGWPVYDETSAKVMVDAYDKVYADFTATQRGCPYGNWVFDYGVHIVADRSAYAFDTADYKQAVDKDGNLVYDMDGKPLYKYGYAVDDEEFEEFDEESDVGYAGVAYDPKKFVWHILPVPFQSAWLDLDEYEITVPAGAVSYWNYDDEPAEDYTIIAMDDEPQGWPFAGQYDYGADGNPYFSPGYEIYFPTGANFYGEVIFKNIAYGWNFGMPLAVNVDTITCTDAISVDDLKKAVHLYPLNLTMLKPFGVDDFKITVMDGDGDLIVFEDKVLRSGMDSDWYTIRISGNMATGFYGDLYGSFFLVRESSEIDVTPFEYEDYKGGVMITGYSGSDADVVIPDVIGDKKVVAIGDKAFANNKTIKTLKVGSNVKTIGMKAFYGCSKLTSVELSDSVQVISYYAFYGCNKLADVQFGHGLKAVRSNAFSVDFLLWTMEFFKGRSAPSNVTVTETDVSTSVSIFANYLDEDGKTQYYAEALNGNAFVLGETAKVLELYPGFSTSELGYGAEVIKEPVPVEPFRS